MGWQDDIGNFNLSRLSLAGWVVFLLSIAAAFISGILFFGYWDTWFLRQDAQSGRRSRLPALAGIVFGLGMFFSAKWLLGLAGIQIVSPLQARIDTEGLTKLHGRVIRNRRWRRAFCLMMPLGFVLPCGLGILLAYFTDASEGGNRTLFNVLLLSAIFLPFIGLAGWWLMKGDAQKYAQELADAERALASRDRTKGQES